ncbi:hypothetical protein SFA35_25115 (plasmid) [Pseudomonas sp. HR96]|nr:hypothetical protein [Pseudomonas sp. HR96]WPP02450.1 hypothetical protein SFA35_25115 [Pseudomonas sp. HR96]
MHQQILELLQRKLRGQLGQLALQSMDKGLGYLHLILPGVALPAKDA